MVYVLPCHFDARHRHGGTTIYNNRTINIFGGGRRSHSCSGSFGCGSFGFGFGGGNFWNSLANGLGMGFGMGLFNGLSSWLSGGSFLGGMFPGMGGGQNYGAYQGGYQGNTAGSGTGCSCGCAGTNNGLTSLYRPGQFGLTGDGNVDGAGAKGKGDGNVDGAGAKGKGDGNVDGAGAKGKGDGNVDGAGPKGKGDGNVDDGTGGIIGGKKIGDLTGDDIAGITPEQYDKLSDEDKATLRARINGLPEADRRALAKNAGIPADLRIAAKQSFYGTRTNYDGKTEIAGSEIDRATDLSGNTRDTFKINGKDATVEKAADGNHPQTITIHDRLDVTYTFVKVEDGEYIYQSDKGGQLYALQKDGDKYDLVQYDWHDGYGTKDWS